MCLFLLKMVFLTLTMTEFNLIDGFLKFSRDFNTTIFAGNIQFSRQLQFFGEPYPDAIPYYIIHFIHVCLWPIYGLYRRRRIQINNETFLVSICRVFRGLASVKPIKTGTIFIFHVLKSIFIILISLADQKFSYSISLKNLLKSLNLI